MLAHQLENASGAGQFRAWGHEISCYTPWKDSICRAEILLQGSLPPDPVIPGPSRVLCGCHPHDEHGYGLIAESPLSQLLHQHPSLPQGRDPISGSSSRELASMGMLGAGQHEG